MRYPSVSRFHFLECSGNGLADWLKTASTTVQQTHGLLSGGQWTGIPVSWLLDEAGLQPGGEVGAVRRRRRLGAHALDPDREGAWTTCLIVYGANGEMLRPENGYPLRVLVPGWEGNVSVKWLRRIKVSDQPWHFRSETARYTDPMPEGKWRQFSFEMECKSVITRPSGGMKLDRPGPVEIQSASRGRATAASPRSTSSVDGGRNWQRGRARGPGARQVLTRFRYRWNWNGSPAMIQSRAVDSTGYVQPTVADIQKARAIVGFVQHHNGIQPWSISAAGEVKNAIALSGRLGVAAALAVSGLRPDAGRRRPTPAKPAVGYGKPISDADIAPWNIDIRTSDGRGLPAGQRHRGAGQDDLRREVRGVPRRGREGRPGLRHDGRRHRLVHHERPGADAGKHVSRTRRSCSTTSGARCRWTGRRRLTPTRCTRCRPTS